MASARLPDLEARPEQLQSDQACCELDIGTLTSDLEAAHISNSSANEDSTLHIVQSREETPAHVSALPRVRLPEATTIERSSPMPGKSDQNIASNEAATTQPLTTPMNPNPDAAWGGVAGEPSPTLKTLDEVEQTIVGKFDKPFPFPAVIVGDNFSTMPKRMAKKDEIRMSILFFIRSRLRSFLEVLFTLPSRAGDEPVVASWFITKENVTGCSFESIPVTAESLHQDDKYILELDKSLLRDAEGGWLWKLNFTYVPTSSGMTSNVFAGTQCPETGLGLESFRSFFAQERYMTFLLRGTNVLEPATNLQKAWEREDNKLLNTQWFPDQAIDFQWALLKNHNPDHRPCDRLQSMRVFYDFEEYYTLQGFGIVQDFEYEWQNALALENNRNLSVTTLTIPGAGNRRYFMFLALPWSLSALRLTEGYALQLNFFLDDDLEDEERDKRRWTAHVQRPLSYAPEAHLTLIATRRWIRKDGWVEDNPENPLRPIHYDDHHTHNTLRNTIRDAESTPVRVSIISNQIAKKQLHALNTLSENIKKDKVNIQHILARGDYKNVPRVNVLQGVDPAALIRLKARPLNEQQRSFVRMLENGVPAGLGLGRGPPGTGKTWILKEVARAFVESNKSVMVTASMNLTVTRLATGLGGLARELKQFLQRDIIVVRLHAKDTELALFHGGRWVEQNNTGRPQIIPSTTSLPIGSLAESLQQKYVEMEVKVGQDDRVQNTELALFSWMQRWLGIKTDDLLEENKLRDWGILRELYDEDQRVELLDDDDRKLYEKSLKALVLQILRKADIIVCTLAGAAAPWVREAARPEVIFVDEAGKSKEAELFPVLAHFPGAKYILVGDHHQLPPTVMSPVSHNNLAPQMFMTLFERLQKNGFDSMRFNEQHRMIPQIGDLVSRLFYGGEFRNASSMNGREMLPDICKYNEEKFGIDSPVVLVNLKNSKEDRLGLSMSRVNFDNLSFVLNLVIDLAITKSIAEPEEVLVLTAYTAQSVQYSLAVENCAKDNNPAIHKVKWHKIDSSQGDESEVVVLDLTVQSSIGFMEISNRLHVALSRAKFALYIIGNDDVFNSTRSKVDCKYLEQLWDYCEEMEVVVDIEENPSCKYVGYPKSGYESAEDL